MWVKCALIVALDDLMDAARCLAAASGDPREATGDGFVACRRGATDLAVCDTALQPTQLAALKTALAKAGVAARILAAPTDTLRLTEASADLLAAAGERIKLSQALARAGIVQVPDLTTQEQVR